MSLTRLVMVEVNLIGNGDIATIWSRFMHKPGLKLRERQVSFTEEGRKKGENANFDTLWFSK